MRRALILGFALAAFAGMAYAGDYHFGANLICSDCHVMHGSRQHDYDGGTTGFPVTYTDNIYLLKGTVNETCLSCHDGVDGPDVYGADTSGWVTADRRSGGALNQHLATLDGSYESWMGHTLDSPEVAPGEAGSFDPGAEGLECTDCHHQHGRASGNDVTGAALSANDADGDGTADGVYRNLKPRSASSGGSNIAISYARGMNNLAKDVFETAPNAYEIDEVNLNEPVTTNSGFGAWCGDCHKNYHGLVGDPTTVGGMRVGTAGGEEFLRHPNADVDIGVTGSGHSSLSTFRGRLYRVRVMSASGDWGTVGSAWAASPTDLTPTCLSCHRGHGTTRPFGLIYATGAAHPGENGDGTESRALCKQCHSQG